MSFDLLPPQLTTSSEQVQRLFNRMSLPFHEVPIQTRSTTQQLQVVILQDDKQHLAAILSRAQILDLRMLNAQTQSNYQADLKQTDALKKRLQTHELPALPDVLGLPCVYASHLVQRNHLSIESGTANTLVEVQQKDFIQLMRNARALKFTHDLIPVSQPDVQQAHPTAQSLTRLRIKQRLEETAEIPPLSMTAQKILKLRANPDAFVDDLTSIIETDPTMAAQVMSWASSPYYAAPGKIRSIEDAIVRVLGFDLVINLALGLALGKTLKLPRHTTRQNRNYWQQAIYTATLIEGLVRVMPRQQRPEPGIAYLAGLLHSFGYVLLAHIFPPHFQLVNQYLDANPHLAHGYIEQYLLGTTREQMGAWLMQHWQMPDELIIAIREQNNSDYQGPQAVYAQLIFLASQLLAKPPVTPDDIPANLCQKLAICAEDALRALENVTAAEQALRQLAAQFSS